MTVAILALTLAAAALDLRSREIPDWIAVVILGIAAVAAGLGWEHPGWLSLMLGGAAAFAVGFVLFCLGGMRGGDVKLYAAIGTALGWPQILVASFWIALVGGGLALVAWFRKQCDLAYAPAIAGGFLVYTVLRLGLSHVILRSLAQA